MACLGWYDHHVPGDTSTSERIEASMANLYTPIVTVTFFVFISLHAQSLLLRSLSWLTMSIVASLAISRPGHDSASET